MAWAAAGDAEMLTVAVVPEARRRGLGAALVTAAGVAALVRGAASMHLEVAENNEAARALYAKLGYEEAGRRHAYYAGEGGSVDAIVMRRTLPRPACETPLRWTGARGKGYFSRSRTRWTASKNSASRRACA